MRTLQSKAAVLVLFLSFSLVLSAEPDVKNEVGADMVKGGSDEQKAKPNPILSSILSVLSPLIAQVVFFSPMDAMRKIRAEGTTGSLTAIPYTAMMTSCSIWITYGLLSGDPTIWLPNVTGAMFGAYYMYTFSRFIPADVSMTPHYTAVAMSFMAAILILVIMPGSQALPLVGYIGVALVVIMFGGPLATIQTVIKTKSTASLPPFFTAASFCNCLLWASYGGLIINDPFIWGPNLLGLMATIAQILLFFVYGLPPPSIPAHKELKENNI